MNSQERLAQRILEDIRERGWVNKANTEKYIKLDRKEAKEVIRFLIDLVEDPTAKDGLFDLLERHQHRYDPRLELLVLWIHLSGGSVKEDLDSEDVI